MTTSEELSGYTVIFVVIAAFNWLAGSRSVMGRELILRQGHAWNALRWFGLGLWASSAIAETSDDVWLRGAGLCGALFLLVGTARQFKETPRQVRENKKQNKAEMATPRKPSDDFGRATRRAIPITLIWLMICQVDIVILSYHCDGLYWGGNRVETRNVAG